MIFPEIRPTIRGRKFIRERERGKKVGGIEITVSSGRWWSKWRVKSTNGFSFLGRADVIGNFLPVRPAPGKESFHSFSSNRRLAMFRRYFWLNRAGSIISPRFSVLRAYPSHRISFHFSFRNRFVIVSYLGGVASSRWRDQARDESPTPLVFDAKPLSRLLILTYLRTVNISRNDIWWRSWLSNMLSLLVNKKKKYIFFLLVIEDKPIFVSDRIMINSASIERLYATRLEIEQDPRCNW